MQRFDDGINLLEHGGRLLFNGMAALAYSPSSDRRSWQYMKYFFKEIFSEM